MPASLIYRNAHIYALATRVLYGPHHDARLRAVAELIPRESSVLECCCGPGLLYARYLKAKGVHYTGLDINAGFVDRITRLGGRGEVRDLREPGPLPRADYVVMQASLYHFLPHAAPIVEGMLGAARKQVIIAEPVRNLASSRSRWLAAISAALADPGTGQQPHRFTEPSLDDLFSRFTSRVVRSFLIAGEREKVYVLAS